MMMMMMMMTIIYDDDDNEHSRDNRMITKLIMIKISM
jgi:hypothetical protein